MQPNFVLMLFCLIVQPTQDYKFVDTCTVILAPDISLYLKASIFVPKRHSIDSCQIGPADDPWKGICLIDGRPVFGTDWDLPRTTLDEAYVIVAGRKVSLEVSCMYNPWIASADKESFSVQKTEGGFIISGHFSDGAGSYDAQWLIIRGRSVRIKLVEGEC